MIIPKSRRTRDPHICGRIPDSSRYSSSINHNLVSRNTCDFVATISLPLVYSGFLVVFCIGTKKKDTYGASIQGFLSGVEHPFPICPFLPGSYGTGMSGSNQI